MVSGMTKYPRLGPFRVSEKLTEAFNMLCIAWDCTHSEAFRRCVRLGLEQNYIKEDDDEEGSEGEEAREAARY